MFVTHRCPQQQWSHIKGKESHILTPLHSQGHVMSQGYEQPFDELIVQVLLLYVCLSKHYGQMNQRPNRHQIDLDTPSRSFRIFIISKGFISRVCMQKKNYTKKSATCIKGTLFKMHIKCTFNARQTYELSKACWTNVH